MYLFIEWFVQMLDEGGSIHTL